MSLAKQYRLRGMSNRNNGLGQALTTAAAVQNMVQDKLGNWVTRPGSDETGAHANVVLDEVYYDKGDELLVLTPTSLRRVNGAALDVIPFGGTVPTSWTVPASFGEYSGVMYWSDPALNVDLWKYDGAMQYRAGMPQASGATAAGAGSKYYRIYIYHTDYQGNTVSGDYVQFGPIASGASFTMNTLKNTEFYNCFAVINGNQVITLGSPTVTVNVGHSFTAGSYFYTLETVGFTTRRVTVLSVTATTITFDYSDLEPTDTFSLTSGNPLNMSTTYFSMWNSDNETFGYVSDNATGMNNAATTQVITSVGSFTSLPMEDVYDPTDVKGLPPRMAYLTFYNNVMVMGRKQLNTSPQVTSGTPKDQDTFAWSNLLVGSTVETFAPYDTQVIGKTDEGGITGLFGGDYALVVMKQKQVYFISGILFGRQFSIINALTNGIGCVSHRSIFEIMGGCGFMSSKGVYTAIGQSVQEISDVVEPFLTDNQWGLDLTQARAVSIPDREKIYISIPATLEANDVIMVYDYYWQDWSYYYGISCRKGLAVKNDALHWADSSSYSTEAVAFNDDGVAIDAFWEGQHVDFGSPSLKKKFAKFILLSICQAAWTAYLETFINWGSSVVDTSATMDVDPTDEPIVDAPLSMSKCYATKVRVGCDTINQQAVISGIELVVEAVQLDPKVES